MLVEEREFDLMAGCLGINKSEEQIRSILLSLRNSLNNGKLGLESYDSLEMILDIALCYQIDLVRCGTSLKQMMICNSQIFGKVGRFSSKRYNIICIKIYYYFWERSRWKP